MPNQQNFANIHQPQYTRSLNVAPRGRIIVPAGHQHASAPTAAPSAVTPVATSPSAPVASAPAAEKIVVKQASMSNEPTTTPVVHLDDLMRAPQAAPMVQQAAPTAKPAAPAAKPVIKSAIKPAAKLVMEPVAPKQQPAAQLTSAQLAQALAMPEPVVSPFVPLPVQVEPPRKAPKKTAKPARHLAERAAKLAEHAKHLKAQAAARRQEKSAAKAKRRQDFIDKLEQSAAAPTNFASQALAAAAEIKTPEADGQTAVPLAIDNGGAAALDQAKPNPLARAVNSKLTFTFKINTARLFAVLRAVAVAIILAVSGYLAWDTWMTNRTVENSFANPASAMSIDGTNPVTADPTSISDQQWSAYTTPADQPRYIYIPSINVRARVLSVGVTSQGNIDTPKNLNDTAWYDGSAKPNQDGEVFIDGHTSFSSSLAAAFNDLPKIKNGDTITVELGNGDKVNYKVVTAETVAANKVDMGKALNTPTVDGVRADKGLTLMTCTGTFNYRTQSSDKRFIVYAVQE